MRCIDRVSRSLVYNLVDMHDKRSFIFMYHGFRIVNLEQVDDIVYYHIGLLIALNVLVFNEYALIDM